MAIILNGSTGITTPDLETAAAQVNGVDVVTTTASQTITNKTISTDNNTISRIAASSFVLSNASGNIDGSSAQKVIPSGAVVGTIDGQTLTNKTISSTPGGADRVRVRRRGRT